jgi:plasmid stabilization system protein ParE
MAPARVIRSAHARRDLDDIWRYLDGEARPEVADRVVSRIVAAIHRAAEQPSIHRQRLEHAGAPRRVNVLRYAIFFEALPEGDGIFVWRVVHGVRDLSRRVRRPVAGEGSEEH